MTKATTTRGDTEITALEKRVDEKFQVLTSDMEEIKTNVSDMAKKFDEVMNAIQDLRKNKESVKDVGSINRPSTSTKPKTVVIQDSGEVRVGKESGITHF